MHTATLSVRKKILQYHIPSDVTKYATMFCSLSHSLFHSPTLFSLYIYILVLSQTTAFVLQFSQRLQSLARDTRLGGADCAPRVLQLHFRHVWENAILVFVVLGTYIIITSRKTLCAYILRPTTNNNKVNEWPFTRAGTDTPYI